MKKFLSIMLTAACFFGCKQEDFRGYNYKGVFFCGIDTEFYELEASFFPSDGGRDLLIITQKNDDGDILESSGFIVKVDGKDLVLFGGAKGKPELCVRMENGKRYTHSVSFISRSKDAISLYDNPNGGQANFHLRLERGEKSALDLYKK